jgi:hypothetical protein
MQLTGAQAIIFGTRITPEYCPIFMKTNFLDICIRFNMNFYTCGNFHAKKGQKR